MANLSLSEINYQKLQDLEYRLEKLKAEIIVDTEKDKAQDEAITTIMNNYALKNSTNLTAPNKKSWKNIALEKTLLWSGFQSEAGALTLSESIDNFTNLYFIILDYGKINYFLVQYPVADFKNTTSQVLLHLPLHDPIHYKWINIYYSSSTQMSIFDIGNCFLLKIYGE